MTTETKIRDLRARMHALETEREKTRCALVRSEAAIDAAAEACALTDSTLEIERARRHKSELALKLETIDDTAKALQKLIAQAEREQAAESEARRVETVAALGVTLAKEADAVHAAIATLNEACRTYLTAAGHYAATARETDRDCAGHPMRVRESLRGVLTIELREFAAAPGSIPSAGKMPKLYGADKTRDWLAA